MRVLANGKVKRTEAEWREIMEKFRASGLSRAEFCKREDIANGSFSKWQQRLMDSKASTGSFVELTASQEPASSPEMELSLPGGVVLRWKF